MFSLVATIPIDHQGIVRAAEEMISDYGQPVTEGNRQAVGVHGFGTHPVPHSKPTRLVDWLKSLALLISLALALIWTIIFIVIWAMSTATS